MQKSTNFVLLIFALLSLTQAFGQSVSIYVKTNYSFPSVENENNNNYTTSVPSSTGYTSTYTNVGNVNRKTKANFGGNVGVEYNWNLNSRFGLTTGLGATILRYNQKDNVESNSGGLEDIILEINTTLSGTIYTNSGQPYGTLIGTTVPRDAAGNIIVNSDGFSTILGSTRKDGVDFSLLYLDIPIIGSYRITNKVNASIGVDFSYLLFSERKYDSDIYSANFGIREATFEDQSKNGMNQLVISTRVGFDYQLFKNIYLTAEFKRSLNSLYTTSEWNPSNYNAKNNTIAIGLNYYLLIQK